MAYARHRERDDSLVDRKYHADWFRLGSIQPFGDYAFSPLCKFPLHIDRIDDVVGNKGGFNPVSHFSLESTMTQLNPWLSATGDPRHLILDGIWIPLRASSFLDLPWMPAISAATLSDWSLEAYSKFTEQVPTKVSLANFIYELKDMKGMIPSITKGSVTKTVSNNFLAFEFGVLPFVSDVKAILALTDSVSKRIDHLLKTQGKTTNLSFDRDSELDTPYTFGVSMYDGTLTNVGFRVEFKRLSVNYHFHCGAKLFQDLSGLTDSLAQLKALGAAAGFNHPARIIWNAIPYSFIVDWFFHVGKLLDTLTVQPFGGTYDVKQVGWSMETETTFLATQIVPDGTYVDTSQLGTVTFKGYTRSLGFPATSVFLTNGSLTPMQLALSAALLEQRRK